MYAYADSLLLCILTHIYAICIYIYSTLLKMIAYGELKIPPRIDYLYVEQEVMADNTSAVDAVLKADKYVYSSFSFDYIDIIVI